METQLRTSLAIVGDVIVLSEWLILKSVDRKVRVIKENWKLTKIKAFNILL